MSEVGSIQLLNDNLHQLAEELYQWVERDMACTNWTLAVLDIRYGADGSSLRKARLIIPDASPISLESSPPNLGSLVYSLSNMRRTFSREWFSLKLEIDRERRVDIQYGYDPDSVNDPTFFDE